MFVLGLIGCGILASAWIFSTESGREWQLQHRSTRNLMAYTLSHPADALAHRVLAERLLAEGRCEEAATTSATWSRLEPGSARPLITKGRALLLAGKPQDALEPLTEALRYAPHNSHALTTLGEAYYALGERWQAEKYLRVAVDRDSSNAAAQAILASVLADNHNFDAAHAAAERAMEIAPESAEGYVAAGYVADKMGNSLEAIRFLTQAVTIDSYHGRAWELMAAMRVRVARSSEEIAQAEVALTHADHLRPFSPLVPYYRGLLRVKQQQYRMAVAEFRRALERNPHFTDALYNMSLALAFDGKKEESAQVRQQFRRISSYIRERSQLQMRIGRDPQRADLWERLARLAEVHGDAQMAKLARSRMASMAKHSLPTGD